jgi:hypothetical protein
MKLSYYKTARQISSSLFVKILFYSEDSNMFFCEVPTDNTYKTYNEQWLRTDELSDFCL